jgi:ATP-dependent RNA helicase DeaD
VAALDEDRPTVATLDQRYFSVAEDRKLPLLCAVFDREKPELALVFTRTKKGAERVGKALARKRFDAQYIHGDLPQRKRDRAVADFREGKTHILVATDVMGRGIDVPNISHVINYNIPEYAEDYLHRVGRSSRMNAPGKAITFVTPDQGKEITAIEVLCNCLIEEDHIEGFDAGLPTREPAPPPSAPAAGPARATTKRRRRPGRRRRR